MTLREIPAKALDLFDPADPDFWSAPVIT